MNLLFKILLSGVLLLSVGCSRSSDLNKMPGANKSPGETLPINPSEAELVWTARSVMVSSTLIGDVGETVLTLKNTGKKPSLPITLSLADGENIFRFKTGEDTCTGEVLQGGATCQVTVRFHPLLNGVKNTTLLATDSSKSDLMYLYAEGKNPNNQNNLPAQIEWAIQSYDYGSILSTVFQNITLTAFNSGGHPTGVLTTNFIGTSLPIFSMVAGENNCLNKILNPAESCTVKVRFSPALAQHYDTKLKITDTVTEATIDLSGTGLVQSNPIPSANAQSITVTEDVTYSGTLTGTDPDGRPLTYSLESQGGKGVVTVNANGSFSYIPNANETGVDSFSFKVNNGLNNSNAGSVTVVISPVNDAPIALNKSVQVIEDLLSSGILQGTDVDSTVLTYTILTQPTKGSLVLTNSLTGAFIYTPNANATGADSFTFKVSDGALDSNVGTVSLNIEAINDLPTVQNQILTVQEDTATNFTVIANDADGDTLTYVIVTQPLHGTISGSGPTFTYTPNSNYNGLDAVTYRVSDGTASSLVATLAITVVGGNDDPVAQNKTLTLNEDTPKISAVSATDDDLLTVLTYSVVTEPTKGTLIFSALTGAFTYTPNLNANGTDTFTFKASDGQNESNVATVTLNITPVNDLPTASAVNLITDMNTPVSVTLLGEDVDGDTLTYTVVNAPSHGTLTGTGSNRTYTPNTNYSGVETFTYRVNDGFVNSGIAIVTIQVVNTNSAPVTQNSTESVNEDFVLTATMVATDNENNPLTYSVVTQPTKGTVLINSLTGSYVYTPTLNANGSDSFTFKVTDGQLQSNTSTVSITINPINDIPVANSKTVSGTEEVPLNITVVASDVETPTLTYSIVTPPTKGTLSGTGPNYTYTPNANANGADSFTYKANDGTADSNVATVTINLAAVNDAPIASNASFTTSEDVAYNGTLVGSDPDGDTITYWIETNPTKGIVSLNNNTGAYVYTPNLNANGSDSFTFKVFDGTVASAIRTVSVTITPVNDEPIAEDQSIEVNEDSSVNITLTATDVEASPLTYTILTQPAHGTITGTGSNRVYTPHHNYVGTDFFTFKVNDGTLDSDSVTISIQVNAFNNAPVAQNQTINTPEDTTYTGVLVATDANGDALTYSVVSQGTKGTVTITNASTGAFTYVPSANVNGSDSFTFRANDGTANSNTATVTVNITAVNDVPVAFPDSISINRNVVKNITLVGFDQEGSPLTYTIVGNPAHGTITGTLPNITYTPVNNYVGPDSFTFRVNDGALNSPTATVSINISNSNVMPVANNSTLAVVEDTVKTGTLVSTDADNDPLTYSVVSQGTKGTVTITNASTGAFTYTPNANSNGSDSFTFRTNDGYGNSNTATITVTIAAVNDIPVADAQSVSVYQNVAKAITLTGSDIEGSSLTYSVVANPTKGSLSGTAPNLTYTPSAGQVGADSFTVKVNDGSADSATKTVSINIVDTGNWWNPSWTKRKKLHLNNLTQGALTNVPVLVKLNSSRITYASTKAGGADLRFLDSSGNVLAHEVERWNSSGESSVWVKVPSLTANSTSDFIWMYYGNSSASHAQNKSAVWSNSFRAVYHLEETSGTTYDSTSYGNNGTTIGSPTRNVGGKIAGAERFTADGQRLSFADNSSLDITSEITLEAVIYEETRDANNRIVNKEGAYTFLSQSGKLEGRFGGTTVVMDSEVPSGSWQYVVITYKDSTNECKFYVQGKLVKTATCSSSVSANSAALTIGGQDDGSDSLFGYIDEVRVSNVARSADWIKSQFLSIFDGAVFFGSEQTYGGTVLKSQLLSVRANNDDGEVTEGGTRNVGSFCFGNQSSLNNWGFVRVQLQTSIPAGSTISNSRIKIFGNYRGSWNSSSHYLGVRLQNSSNAPQLTANNQCPTCSTVTSTVGTTTTWGYPGLTWNLNEWNESPNLSSVVSDLVSTQGGLSANNYLQFWIGRGANFGANAYELAGSAYSSGDGTQTQILIEWY